MPEIYFNLTGKSLLISEYNHAIYFALQSGKEAKACDGEITLRLNEEKSSSCHWSGPDQITDIRCHLCGIIAATKGPWVRHHRPEGSPLYGLAGDSLHLLATNCRICANVFAQSFLSSEFRTLNVGLAQRRPRNEELVPSDFISSIAHVHVCVVL